MNLKYDAGTEKWVQWAKSKLKQLALLRADLRLPKMTKAFVPTSGVLVFVVSSEFGDMIRITGSSFEFIFAENLPAGAGHRLWGAKLNTTTGLYEPQLFDTWTYPSHNPWSAVMSGSIGVVRDKNHQNSATGGDNGILVRAAGITPKDNTFSVPISKSPEYDAYILRGGFSSTSGGAASWGPADVRLAVIGKASVPIDVDAWNARMMVLHPVSSWPVVAGQIWVSGPNSFTIGARVRTGTGATSWYSSYVERFTWSLDTNGNVVINPVPVATMSSQPRVYGTSEGESLYHDPFAAYTYVYRAAIAQRDQSAMTLTDAVFPAGNMRASSTPSKAEPFIPKCFNAAYFGAVQETVGAGVAVAKIEMAGVAVHDDLDMRGFPYFCAVWPDSFVIGDDQYWWINTMSVRSSSIPDPSGVPNDYVYSSPHAYKFRTIILKNRVKVYDVTDTRNYTGFLDSPQNSAITPTDSWDTTTPVYTYVPLDAIMIDGVAWVAGHRVEHVFTTFSAAFGAPQHLPWKRAPAIWRADMTEFHVYTTKQQSFTPGGNGRGTADQRTFYRSAGSLAQFYKYKGEYFFGFQSQVPADSNAWFVVPMTQKDAVPVLITPTSPGRGGVLVPDL